MNKIELEIAQISHGLSQSNSFALLLVEKSGVRKLPIVIGAFEAQAIAIGLEKIKQSRPQTHDLFKSIFDKAEIHLKEIVINKLSEGVFYSLLICEKGGKIFEIDSRTSDAIALAIRFNAPVYTYETIMEQAGIILEEHSEGKEKKKAVETTDAEPKPTNLSQLNKLELESLLEKAIEGEDYERAARIRDELSKRS